MADNLALSLYGFSPVQLRELILVLCLDQKTKETATAHISVMRGVSSASSQLPAAQPLPAQPQPLARPLQAKPTVVDISSPSPEPASPKPKREPQNEQLVLNAGPRTAWEAVWYACDAVRTAYPTLQDRPTAPDLVALLDLPPVRQLRYHAESTRRSDFGLSTTTQAKNRNLKAALLQVTAAASPQECSRCGKRKNLWDVCVGGLGCAGCIYNGQKCQCNYLP
ncbi:hypothetical protein BJ166DRAFT_587639 [Pestalotiopsis sp. NC0098]|nr:hypothetical protein BJ166DRAFT_587639 [Pestalotiopsis sp. NC0098]